MALNSQQLAHLTRSYQRFEARWWPFTGFDLTLGDTNPEQIDLGPTAIIQPRYAICEPGENLILDGSDSYAWPSCPGMTPVSSYLWEIVSGPGSFGGATDQPTANFVAPDPGSDTETVIRLSVTDADSDQHQGYGRIVTPANPNSVLSGQARLRGNFRAGGWAADLAVHGEMTGIAVGNLIVLDVDRFWDGTKANFGPYAPRPQTLLVGYVTGLRAFQAADEWYTALTIESGAHLLMRADIAEPMLFYHNTDFGLDHYYCANFRPTDAIWYLLRKRTNFPDWHNIYMFPDANLIGGEAATQKGALWDVMEDLGGRTLIRPFFTAQNDLYFRPEPCTRTLRWPGGPFGEGSRVFDGSGAGALSEDYLMRYRIEARQQSTREVLLHAQKVTADDHVKISALAQAATSLGEPVEMGGFLVDADDDLDDEWVVDLLNQLNHEHEVEIEAGMFPVLEIGSYADVSLIDPEQIGAETVEKTFWASEIAHEIDFGRGTWRTRANLVEVTEQEQGPGS
jgi:hypothetical protein